MEVAAWIVLRIVFAWMFLYPLIALLKDFKGTVGLVDMIVPFQPYFFTVVMVAVMVVGAISVLFGIYAQIGGILLMFYCLIGARVHYLLAAKAASLGQVAELGVVGNVTSAQKNFVLAAVGFFIFLMGSGPWSITSNLF